MPVYKNNTNTKKIFIGISGEVYNIKPNSDFTSDYIINLPGISKISEAPYYTPKKSCILEISPEVTYILTEDEINNFLKCTIKLVNFDNITSDTQINIYINTNPVVIEKFYIPNGSNINTYLLHKKIKLNLNKSVKNIIFKILPNSARATIILTLEK